MDTDTVCHWFDWIQEYQMRAQQTRHNEPLWAIYQVLTSVCMMIHIFWDVTLCYWVIGYRRFGRRIALTFKTQAVKGELLHLEDEAQRSSNTPSKHGVPSSVPTWYLKQLLGRPLLTLRSILRHKFEVTNHTSTLLLLRPQRVNERLCQKAL